MYGVRSKTKCKVQVGPVLDNSADLSVTEKDMVTAFNDCFVSVFTSEDISSIPTPVTMNSGCSLSYICFSEQDVLKCLTKLWTDKATGADEISLWLLLQIKDCISFPLYLFVSEKFRWCRFCLLEMCKCHTCL